MKNLAKVIIASTTGLLASVYALANQSPSPVYAAAIDNCQIIKQITLSEEESKAWEKIQSLEAQMKSIHAPLKGIENQLSQYGKEIEKLANLAIQDSEQTLYIDKEMMKEQQKVADKMSALVAAHEADFEALSNLGEQIGEQADIFSDTIEAAFDGLDHQRVEIYSAGESPNLDFCSTDKMM